MRALIVTALCFSCLAIGIAVSPIVDRLTKPYPVSFVHVPTGTYDFDTYADSSMPSCGPLAPISMPLVQDLFAI